jgi:non-heme chloroperoxidase
MKAELMIAVTATLAVVALALAGQARTQNMPTGAKSGFVTATDGAKIHYVEAGAVAHTVMASGVGPQSVTTTVETAGQMILFVPGWTMPGWIWQKQIDYFAPKYRVVAMDPRCQGESSQTSDGMYPAQMARDIKAVIEQLHLAPVVLVGWSMAVAEVGAYVDQFSTRDLSAIVLVDGGMGDAGRPGADQDFAMLKGILTTDRKSQATGFIRGLCLKRAHPEEEIDRMIEASASVPTNSAVALLAGFFSANYWPALAKFDKPTLIIGANTAWKSDLFEEHEKIPGARLEILDNVGHAVFVDDPEEFNAKVGEFIASIRR